MEKTLFQQRHTTMRIAKKFMTVKTKTNFYIFYLFAHLVPVGFTQAVDENYSH